MLLWFGVKVYTPCEIRGFICVQSTSKVSVIALLCPSDTWKCLTKSVCAVARYADHCF